MPSSMVTYIVTTSPHPGSPPLIDTVALSMRPLLRGF